MAPSFLCLTFLKRVQRYTLFSYLQTFLQLFLNNFLMINHVEYAMYWYSVQLGCLLDLIPLALRCIINLIYRCTVFYFVTKYDLLTIIYGA